tara:strand:- start:123 stop:320 length:198 start_codon:yes stop_codon:yes gene_type:complete
METILKLVFLFFFTFLMAFLFFRSWAEQEKTSLEFKELVKQCQDLAMDRQRQAAAIVRSWLNQTE